MRRIVAIWAVCGGLWLPGCGGGGGSDPATLADSDRAAINSSATMLDLYGQFLSTFAPVVDVALNETRQGGGCPAVSVDRGTGQVTITLDYGTGCSHSADLPTIAGSVAVTANLTTGTAAVALSNLTIGGVAVTGTASLQLAGTVGSYSFDGMTVTGNLAFAGEGTVSGSATLDFTPERAVILTTGQLALTPVEGPTTTVTADDLVMDPLNNGSFLPEAGTLTIVAPASVGGGTVTLVVTFSADTIEDGTVTVTVNGRPAGTHQLPGLTD
ncbi:MAG: hypothetical protein IT204_00805 [Fimbriimonadaceae bacterium]|nr:hypothetical protein [Fimbriimonadaceae bacterium]